MKSTKKKLPLIDDKTVLEISHQFKEMRIKELDLRKLLFKFIKNDEVCFERVDKRVYDRKFKRGYMKDLTSIQLGELAEEMVMWRETRKEACKDCIIIVNCSKECQKFSDALGLKHLKEIRNEQDN